MSKLDDLVGPERAAEIDAIITAFRRVAEAAAERGHFEPPERRARFVDGLRVDISGTVLAERLAERATRLVAKAKNEQEAAEADRSEAGAARGAAWSVAHYDAADVHDGRAARLRRAARRLRFLAGYVDTNKTYRLGLGELQHLGLEPADGDED